MEYDNTNRGVLFENDKKGNDKAPDYQGNINVNGKEKQIAGWEKESKAGKMYISISVSEPYKKENDKTEEPEF